MHVHDLQASRAASMCPLCQALLLVRPAQQPRNLRPGASTHGTTRLLMTTKLKQRKRYISHAVAVCTALAVQSQQLDWRYKLMLLAVLHIHMLSSLHGAVLCFKHTDTSADGQHQRTCLHMTAPWECLHACTGWGLKGLVVVFEQPGVCFSSPGVSTSASQHTLHAAHPDCLPQL
jgi:hypothetical protein